MNLITKKIIGCIVFIIFVLSITSFKTENNYAFNCGLFIMSIIGVFIIYTILIKWFDGGKQNGV